MSWHNNSLPLPARLICISSVVIIPPALHAGEVKFESNINSTAYVYQTKQDDADNNNNKALVLEPSVSAIYTSKKANLVANATHTQVTQQDKTKNANKDYTDLKLSSNLVLIDNALNFSASGSQNYRTVNSDQDFFSDPLLSAGELSKIKSYDAGLNFITPNADYLILNVNTNYSDTSSTKSINANTGLDGSNLSVNANLRNANTVRSVLFNFSVRYNNTSRDNQSDFTSKIVSGTTKALLYKNIYAVVQGSKETYDGDLQLSSRTNLDSHSYGYGFDWRIADKRSLALTYNNLTEGDNTNQYVGINVDWAFSPRTAIKMDYSKRFYGDAYNLNFIYNSKSIRSNLTYSENVTTFSRLNAMSQSFGIFVCSIGSSNLADCFQPGSLSYVLQPGEEFRALNQISPEITNEVILSKNGNFVLGYDRRKLKISLNLGYNQTEYLESNRLENYKNASVNISYQLSRKTDVGFNINELRRALNSENTLSISLTANRKLSKHASINSSLRYLDRNSDSKTREATDKRFSVGFNYQF